MDFVLGCVDKGLIAATVAAAAAAAFEEAGIFPLRGGNGFPMHARKFDFRLKTLFASCEAYSWCSTVSLEDSKHKLSKISFFLRNY